MKIVSVFLGLVLGKTYLRGGFNNAGEVFVGYSKLQGYVDLVKFADKLGVLKSTILPLSPPRKNYPVSDSQIEKLLGHSFLSTCSGDEVKLGSCFCPEKFERATVVFNETLESQAVVAADPNNKLVVVSYRGTITAENWKSNEDFAKVNYPLEQGPSQVHGGHLGYYRSLQKPTEAAALKLLSTPKYKGYKLHITGYSLGGSIAAISTPAWSKLLESHKLDTKMQVFLYSNPRPGNIDFARYVETLGAPIIRYARAGDVVPHIPEQLMGFSQVGQEYFDRNPDLPLQRCRPDLIEDGDCALSVKDFDALNHLLPFGRFFPTPKFC